MNAQIRRALAGLLIAIAGAGLGYVSHATPASADIPTQEVAAPKAGTTRVIYSLQNKQNDQELIAVINDAEEYVYFAIYEFTLKDVADALVAAKERGVDVRGVVDTGETNSSYDAPIIAELKAAGIPIKGEKHADGNGIMHIKALATESAYAMGSYNWTGSATKSNDELLEIGTEPSLVQIYTNILKKLIDTYPVLSAAPNGAAVVSGTYSYTDASKHIGEYAAITGILIDAHTTSTGTVFLDFCTNYKTCPFSGVIFADDAKAFGDLSKYAGKSVTLTGKISSYQNKAEIILNSPDQIK